MSLRALPLALLVALLPACDDTVGPDGSFFAYEVSVFAVPPTEVTDIVALNDLGQALVSTAEETVLSDGETWTELPFSGEILTDDGVVVGVTEGGGIRTLDGGIGTDLGEGNLLGVDRDGRIWAERDGSIFVRIGDAWEERTFEAPDDASIENRVVGGQGLLAGRFKDPNFLRFHCFLSEGDTWEQVDESNECFPVEIEDSGLALFQELRGGGHWFVWDPAQAEKLPVNVGGVVRTAFDMNDHGTVIGRANTVTDEGGPFLIQRSDTIYGARFLFDTTRWSLSPHQGAINNEGEILVEGVEVGSDQALLLLLTPTQ